MENTSPVSKKERSNKSGILNRQLLLLLVNLVMLGAYWLCEAVIFTWLYGTAPVAIVMAATVVITFIVGLATKKAWITVAFPCSSLAAMAALAVVTRLLGGHPITPM